MTHPCIACDGWCDCLAGEADSAQCDGCGCESGFTLFADPPDANDVETEGDV